MERDLVEKPMDELQGTALQYSCVTAASRGTLRKGEKRVCIFCDKTYAGGPSVIADHIMHPSGSKIAACVPKLEWLQRFNEVSAEMKRRKGPTPTGPTPGEQRTVLASARVAARRTQPTVQHANIQQQLARRRTRRGLAPWHCRWRLLLLPHLVKQRVRHVAIRVDVDESECASCGARFDATSARWDVGTLARWSAVGRVRVACEVRAHESRDGRRGRRHGTRRPNERGC